MSCSHYLRLGTLSLVTLGTLTIAAHAQRVRLPSTPAIPRLAQLPPPSNLTNGIEPFDPYRAPPSGFPPPFNSQTQPPAPVTTPPPGSPVMTPTPPPPSLFGPTSGNTASAEPALWRWELFGEFLYLRPRNAEVVYGGISSGPIQPVPLAQQIGEPGIVQPDYEPGVRLGLAAQITETSRLAIGYTYFRSASSSSLSAEAPAYILPAVIHPATANIAAPVLDASANMDVNFDLLDAEFRALTYYADQTFVEFLIGARYAQLEQEFNAAFRNVGNMNVITDIGFEGAGLRLGLEGERRSTRNGLFIYGRGNASFLAGEFKARYQQTDPAGVLFVNTPWRAGRIVPVLDIEFGAGWINRTGKWRLSGGYLISAWFNTVLVDDYIRGVQNNVFVDLDDTLTFDGLVARVEYRF